VQLKKETMKLIHVLLGITVVVSAMERRDTLDDRHNRWLANECWDKEECIGSFVGGLAGCGSGLAIGLVLVLPAISNPFIGMGAFAITYLAIGASGTGAGNRLGHAVGLLRDKINKHNNKFRCGQPVEALKDGQWLPAEVQEGEDGLIIRYLGSVDNISVVGEVDWKDVRRAGHSDDEDSDDEEDSDGVAKSSKPQPLVGVLQPRQAQASVQHTYKPFNHATTFVSRNVAANNTYRSPPAHTTLVSRPPATSTTLRYVSPVGFPPSQSLSPQVLPRVMRTTPQMPARVYSFTPRTDSFRKFK